MIKRLRQTSDPSKWSAMGFSTVASVRKLVAKDRDKFAAGVSIGGYFEPEADNTTGDLFGGSTELQNQNSPLWLMQQPPVQPTKLLIVVSQEDTQSWAPGESYADSEKTINATKNIPGRHPGARVGWSQLRHYAPTLPQSRSGGPGRGDQLRRGTSRHASLVLVRRVDDVAIRGADQEPAYSPGSVVSGCTSRSRAARLSNAASTSSTT